MIVLQQRCEALKWCRTVASSNSLSRLLCYKLFGGQINRTNDDTPQRAVVAGPAAFDLLRLKMRLAVVSRVFQME